MAPGDEVRPELLGRGHVVVLAGLDERAADFDVFARSLMLAGLRVTIVDDVSQDTDASMVQVMHLIDGIRGSEPLILVGSDLGAALVSGLSAGTRPRPTAVILGNLVTPASRPSTVTVADFTAFEQTSRRGSSPSEHEAMARLPRGVRLPDPHEIRLPALVFHGDNDDVTDVSDAVSWASELPRVSLRLISQGDHHVMTGKHRNSVAAASVLFIERQLAGRAVMFDPLA